VRARLGSPSTVRSGVRGRWSSPSQRGGSILVIAPVLADGGSRHAARRRRTTVFPPQLPERRRGTQAPRACVLALGDTDGGSQRRLRTGTGIRARRAQEEFPLDAMELRIVEVLAGRRGGFEPLAHHGEPFLGISGLPARSSQQAQRVGTQQPGASGVGSFHATANLGDAGFQIAELGDRRSPDEGSHDDEDRKPLPR
jgi:hypothetical protein